MNSESSGIISKIMEKLFKYNTESEFNLRSDTYQARNEGPAGRFENFTLH
jgi:hypothetical protein